METTVAKHPHSKQMHESFKLIKCTIDPNGNLTKDSKKELKTFLANPKLHAMSIGAFSASMNGTDEIVISIGYDEAKKAKNHNYAIVVKKVGEFKHADDQLDVVKLEKQFNAFASKNENIICHEFYQHKENIYGILLTSGHGQE